MDNNKESAQDAKLLGKFGKRVENYGGLNYTLEMREGEGRSELQRWRRRVEDPPLHACFF